MLAGRNAPVCLEKRKYGNDGGKCPLITFQAQGQLAYGLIPKAMWGQNGWLPQEAQLEQPSQWGSTASQRISLLGNLWGTLSSQ